MRIDIYDIRGVLVRQYDLGYQPAGYYVDRPKAAYWDGRNNARELVASGVYFYMLSAGDFTVDATDGDFEMKGGNIVNFKEKLLYMGVGFLFASAGYMLANWQNTVDVQGPPIQPQVID